MIQQFREQRYLREVPLGTYEVQGDTAPFNPVYVSGEANTISGIASGRVSAIIKRQGRYFKAKKIAPRKADGTLLSDEDFKEGALLAIYSGMDNPTDLNEIHDPFGLMPWKFVVGQWERLGMIEQYLKKRSLNVPFVQSFAVKYPNLDSPLLYKGGKQMSLGSIYHEIRNPNFDLRLNEVIQGLAQEARSNQLSDDEINRATEICINLNISRGANAKMMQTLHINPHASPISQDNYSLVSYDKEKKFGLFFHDLETYRPFEKTTDKKMREVCREDSIPRPLLALAAWQDYKNKPFTAFLDFAPTETLLRNERAKALHQNYVEAFHRGFMDSDENLQTVPKADLEWLIGFMEPKNQPIVPSVWNGARDLW